MCTMSSRRGFTLVELSIVLVILGLLVGGVLSGQSLIRAAELRAITRELDQFKTAMNTFKDKYFALPGDMTNAVKYWGAAAGGNADGLDSTCMAYTTAATDTKTCNGNGDGLVARWDSANVHEMHRFWQHLASAGMVEGSFTGVQGPSWNDQAVYGTNAPRSKISGAGWSVWGMGNYTDSNIFPANYGNILIFGTRSLTEYRTMPIIKAEEAYNIDMKVDDGKPKTGTVMTMGRTYPYNSNCLPASNDVYDLSNQSLGCIMLFLTGY